MKLTLLGVMGSIPGGTSDLGKNTTCLLLEDGDKSLVIDSGSGIMKYSDNTKNDTHHILFTHFHLDHVIGLPFFKQIYSRKNTINIYGPTLYNIDTKEMMSSLFKKPFLPINHNHLNASITHTELKNKSSYTINSFTVNTLKVNHPGECMVYSIQKDHKKITILTDFPNEVDHLNDVLELCDGSDIIYIDSYVTKKELETFADYGHCSVEKAIELFKKANSKKLLLSHHRSNRQYEQLKHFETDKIIVAKEDSIIQI